MKRSLFFLMVLCLLAAGTPAYSAVDGIWLHQSAGADDETVGAMVMVIDGTMYVAALPVAMNDWLPLVGPFDGTTAYLSQWFNQRTFVSAGNISQPQSMSMTFTLTSPTTATLTITSCVDFPQYDNCAPVGSVFNITKLR